jgi:CubicO group peptidase (beta-lactamase class C family)
MNHPVKLPRSQPEAQGITSNGIIQFLNAIEGHGLELHSFMLLRHGHVVAEGWWDPYKAKLPHVLYSLSKSFTSTAIGLAAAEGILTLDDPVIMYFPDDLPNEISTNLAAMQIRHLLMMGTGHEMDTVNMLWSCQDGNWVKTFLQAPVDFEPGTYFKYNTGATYMLSAIIQKITGQTLLDYLQPRLMEPLNIVGATWQSCPRGVNMGGLGLKITTEDIAKFGQLYLQKGNWNDTQLLPTSWIEEATSKRISNGDGGDNYWEQGYGYQFWLSQHGSYRAAGAFGQFCIVLPEEDAVVAITSGEPDMEAILNDIGNHLLPAMQPHVISPNERSVALLETKLQDLKLVPRQLIKESLTEADITGKYRFEANKLHYETFSLSFGKDEAEIGLKSPWGENVFRLGRGEWIAGISSFNYGIENKMMSSFTWRDSATLEITLRFIETPFYQTIICRLEGSDLILDSSVNVSFGPREAAPIRGKRV